MNVHVFVSILKLGNGVPKKTEGKILFAKSDPLLHLNELKSCTPTGVPVIMKFPW